MNKITTALVVGLICILSHFSGVNSDEFIRQQTPAFTPDERYQDLFPLSKSNFTAKVLKSTDAWVVLFHSGTIDRVWKSMAVSLRGIVWVGIIDVTTETELLQEIDYKPKNETTSRVYPYGSHKMKLESWKQVYNPNEARSTVLKSLPDHTLHLTKTGIEDFLMDSFMSKPSRFPTLIITEEDDTSALFKSLALRFEKYFNFGKMVRPSMDDLEQLGIEKLYIEMPSVIVLITTGKMSSGSPQFNAIPFNKKSMGELNYPNILSFFFVVNRQFRHLLPAETQSNQRMIAEMEDILRIEEGRFDIQTGEKLEKDNIIQKDGYIPEVTKKNVGSKISDEL